MSLKGKKEQIITRDDGNMKVLDIWESLLLRESTFKKTLKSSCRKVGGSFHIALGKAYNEEGTNNGNTSKSGRTLGHHNFITRKRRKSLAG